MRMIEVFDGIAWWVLSRRKHVDGFHLGVWDGDHDAELLTKVGNALALLKVRDPLRCARAVRDLERIWVLLLPGLRGSFHVETWCCRLDSRFVLASPTETIASVIVHEATHARLFRRGIDYREDLRARIEAVCTRQQAVFAAKTPADEVLQSELRSYAALEASNWTNASLERRRLRGSIDSLRHLGTPDWFVSLALRLYMRRRRHRRRGTT